MIGNPGALAGAGGETDDIGIDIGGLGVVAAIGLEPGVGPFRGTETNGVGYTWAWGKN